MREFLALLRAGWLSALSYRANLLFSVLGLGLMLLPVYFVARALQDVAGPSIANEGGDYFGFLVIGLAVLTVVSTSLTALPTAVGSTIGSGTLETMLATPAGLPGILFGLIGYEMSWSLLRSGLLMTLGLVLGSSFSLAGVPLASLALALTLLAYLGLGLGLAAMILVVRTIGPLGSGLIAASALLGGVYYSTTVIPSWVQQLSFVVPLTYGLRLMRQALLPAGTAMDREGDLLRLALLAGIFLLAGATLFIAGLRHARREGTLGQY